MTCKLPKQLGQNFYGRKKMHIGKDYLPIERMAKRKKKKRELINRILVLCGLVVVNVATFPSLYEVIANNGTPPPASFTGLIMCGLCFYLAYSLRLRLYFYALGEFIGIMLQWVFMPYCIISYLIRLAVAFINRHISWENINMEKKERKKKPTKEELL